MRVPPVAAAILLVALVLAGCKPSAPTKDYAYPAWGFKVSLPGTPVETKQPGAPNGSTPAADRVEAERRRPPLRRLGR